MKNVLLALACISFAIFTSCESPKSEQSNSSVPSQENEAASRLEQEHKTELVAYADSVNRGLREDTERGSARLEVEGQIGDLVVTINHGSPGVRGRVIWNGLVSYDQVWVTGSHWATAVTFSKDIVVGGTEIPAGTYGFFTIPGRENWILIINERYDQHLAEEYAESEDVVRVTTKPIDLDVPVQRLSYRVEPRGEKSGVLAMSWDRISVELPFQVK